MIPQASDTRACGINLILIEMLRTQVDTACCSRNRTARYISAGSTMQTKLIFLLSLGTAFFFATGAWLELCERRRAESEALIREARKKAWLENEEAGKRLLNTAVNGSRLNYASYCRLCTGMSILEVMQIIDGPGTEIASSSFQDGIGSYSQRIEIKTYQWTNLDGSNLIATFQNHRLVSKAQSGLR